MDFTKNGEPPDVQLLCTRPQMRPVLIMANTRFYLDERGSKGSKPCVLKVVIAHKGKSALISLDAKVLPNQWDGKKHRVINHPDQMLMNVYISNVKQQIDSGILSLANEGRLNSMSAAEIKQFIENMLHPEKQQEKEEAERKANSFAARFIKFANTKSKSTCGVYMQTYRRLLAYVGDKLEKLHFEDITKDWLISFDNFMALTAPSKNARNIHLRNIRAVFNDAIDNEITSFYPFRGLTITPEPTPKRNLKVEELRTLFNYPAEEHALYYIDIFKLIFMLIGINVVDLCRLKELVNGRADFKRAKTHRLYSITVEPEAMEIIERHRGKDWLIDVLDHCNDHNNFTRRMDKILKKIGPVKRVGLGGKKIYSPLFPKLSTYWARHTWATIASTDLDIPRDTIAHALGHGTNTVTDIYIDFDQRKVDEANRRVLDWVLYGKK